MKILVWYGKHGEEFFDATDERKALKFLFTILDQECHYYDVVEELETDYIKAIYKKAKSGDLIAINRFMLLRIVHEYERWEFEDLQTDADFEKRFNKEI